MMSPKAPLPTAEVAQAMLTLATAASRFAGAVHWFLEDATGKRRADIFVHTSRWEGFGIVLLEAMLAELPVVATRVSAIPEIVADAETGILVEPGDVSGIARALAQLLDDAGLRRAFGHAGRRRVEEEFSVARMTLATAQVYEEALRR